jgi:hypothetical protein
MWLFGFRPFVCSRDALWSWNFYFGGRCDATGTAAAQPTRSLAGIRRQDVVVAARRSGLRCGGAVEVEGQLVSTCSRRAATATYQLVIVGGHTGEVGLVRLAATARRGEAQAAALAVLPRLAAAIVGPTAKVERLVRSGLARGARFRVGSTRYRVYGTGSVRFVQLGAV